MTMPIMLMMVLHRHQKEEYLLLLDWASLIMEYSHRPDGT